MRGRSGERPQPSTRESECSEEIVDRPKVDIAVEIGGRPERSPVLMQRSGQILVNRSVVGGGIELSHVIAVNDIDMGILAAADGQMPHRSIAVDHIRKYDRSAGAEIDVHGRLRNGIGHRPVIRDLQGVVCRGKPDEAISVIAHGRKAVGIGRNIERAVASH